MIALFVADGAASSIEVLSAQASTRPEQPAKTEEASALITTSCKH
jgi:hypothetical protein